jgi:hypothetical protein
LFRETPVAAGALAATELGVVGSRAFSVSPAAGTAATTALADAYRRILDKGGLVLTICLEAARSFKINLNLKETMKKYISYTMIALLATVAISTAASNEDMMQEKEKAAWEAFKDKKTDDFKKVVSANLVAVYAEGMSDMQKELADMQKWDMKSFAISDYKVTSAGSDTCLTTYKVVIEGTYDGKDQSGTYNAGSVWKKHKGEWQAIFHTNVKEAPAGG